MDFSNFDLVRTWQDAENNGFKLELYDTFQTDRYNKSVLAYRFFHKGELIFEGADFCCSPLSAIDSDMTVAALLCFLSLRPGDTDPEYFAKYTKRQMQWCKEHGETLSNLQTEMEEDAA